MTSIIYLTSIVQFLASPLNTKLPWKLCRMLQCKQNGRAHKYAPQVVNGLGVKRKNIRHFGPNLLFDWRKNYVARASSNRTVDSAQNGGELSHLLLGHCPFFGVTIKHKVTMEIVPDVEM